MKNVPTKRYLDFFSSLGSFNSKLGHILSHSLRLEADVLHVGADLAWDLLEDLLSQVSSCHASVELNELNDVSFASASSSVSQDTIVPIKLFHC